MSKEIDEELTITPTEKLPDDLQAVLDADAYKRQPSTDDLGEELAGIRRRLRTERAKSARLTQQIAALHALVVGT